MMLAFLAAGFPRYPSRIGCPLRDVAWAKWFNHSFHVVTMVDMVGPTSEPGRHEPATRQTVDFFTRYAVAVAFLGFVIFNVGGLTAMALYPFPFSLFHDSYSEVGSIVTGNYGAGLLSAGLALSGILWIPIVLVYARAAIDAGKAKAQPFAMIGFTFQLVGRVAMILVGVFPTKPWSSTHDVVAIMWMAGECLGVILIMIEMLRTRKERAWGIAAILANMVGTVAWLPLAVGAWKGMGVSEFITMTAVYVFNMALWLRAYKGGAEIDPRKEKKA